jgi:nitrilase
MIKVGVVQAAPSLFDVDKTLQTVKNWVQKASKDKCQLVLFPEAFIPGYPRGMDFGTVVGKRTEKGEKQWQNYWENSIAVPGRYTERLGDIARQHSVYLAIGVSERIIWGEGNGTTLTTIDSRIGKIGG